MKTIQLTFIILITISLCFFIKSSHSFNIIQVLPFADGEEANIYHWGALTVILITLWGICGLKKDD